MRKFLFFILICTTLSIISSAKSVKWSVSPQYDEIKPYSETIYFCKSAGKWGLISPTGRVILHPEYDIITSPVNGYALALVNEGQKYRIKCILAEDGSTTRVDAQLYITKPQYAWFSEGKMPVSDRSGKQGFINTRGNIAIRCQFDEVHPFCEGWASVKSGHYASYIGHEYDTDRRRNILPINVNYGEVTFASSFRNGTAVVAKGNTKATIDKSGNKISNYSNELYVNPSDYTITTSRNPQQISISDYHGAREDSSVDVYFENSRYGYRSSRNDIITYPAFATAEPFSITGYACASIDGKYGLLQLIDGEISSFVAKSGETLPLTSKLKASRGGQVPGCDYLISLPNPFDPTQTECFLDNGNGDLQSLVAERNNSGYFRIPFNLHAPNKAKTVNINAVIKHQGITMHKFSQTIEIEYPRIQIVRVSAPYLATATADTNGRQTVVATVYNDSDDPVSVTGTISLKGTERFELTIPAHSSATVSRTVTDIYAEETAVATITLTTGQTASNKVTLKPNY